MLLRGRITARTPGPTGAPSRGRCRLALFTVAATTMLTAACSEGTPTAPADGAGAGPSASVQRDLIGPATVSLEDASVDMAQTSDASWSLTKTGSVDAASSMVTWTVTATEGATEGGHLAVDGMMTVENSGQGGATLGNIVVNLQVRSGKSWTTVASDIADATSGDAATSAHVVAAASSEDLDIFSENAASGHLAFTEAGTNTAFPLVPEVTVGAGDTVPLSFVASFDNNVLGLADGTPTRVEVIVTFGNATIHGSSAPNVDINGNGTIDPDEAHVRSLPTRLGVSVPTETPGNQTVTLTDAPDDISTTGTVTFDNPVFDLGANGGTVTVEYDGGADGGSITNCAHLTRDGADGFDLEACDTQTVDATPACTPGVVGCGWQNGDVVAYSQGNWGATPGNGNAAELLSNNFASVYASNAGYLEVGIPGDGGYSMVFTDASSILDYLPASGLVGALDADLLDPSATAAGSFAGNVLALRLDVDFSDAGLLPGTSGLAFGDLTLCNLTSTPSIDGMTVRDVLATVETALGGGSAPYSIPDLEDLVVPVTGAFGAGVSQFAQDHFFNGACP